jgi:biopolymer transport protein ExbB
MVLRLILVFSLVAWTVAIYEWRQLRAQRGRGDDWIEGALGHLRGRDSRAALGVAADRESLFADLVRRTALLYRDDPGGLQREMSARIESAAVAFATPLDFVACLASSLPLLGLLGTVLGMIETFDALTGLGAADSGGLTGGISTALVTTQTGLVAALPILVVHGYLKSRARDLVNRAQIIARRLETVLGED